MQKCYKKFKFVSKFWRSRQLLENSKNLEAIDIAKFRLREYNHTNLKFKMLRVNRNRSRVTGEVTRLFLYHGILAGKNCIALN
jgi:hypothetical protein